MFWAVSALSALILLASAYGGKVDPRVWALPSLLSLALMPVLGGVAFLTVAGVLLRCWRGVALLAGSLVLALPVLRVNMPVNFSSPEPQGDRFTMMTYNVSVFLDDGATLEYILNQKCDVVAIQEGSLGPTAYDDLEQHRRLRARLDSLYPYRSHGYRDLMILSRWPYTVYEDSTLRQGFGSMDDIKSEYHFYAKMFNIEVKGRPVRLINLHLQSIGLKDDDIQLYQDLTRGGVSQGSELRRAKRSLLGKLNGAFRRRAGEAELVRGVLDSIPAERTIVCGDFNDTPLSFAYRTIAGDDMRDAWADCGLGPTYTFHAHRMWFHIDHVLYGGRLRAINIRRDRAGNSDHYPQVVTFELQ